MPSWSFSTTVGVWDEHPLLECLYEYADVECEVYVKCDLYFGFEGSETREAEYAEALFKSAEVTEINFLPHNNEEGDLKIRVLVTSEMREEIKKIALKKLIVDWSEDEVLMRYHEYHEDEPDQD